MKKDMIEFAALWKNKSQSGNEFWSGNLNAKTKVLVFINGFKKSDKDPDFRIYLAPREEQPQQEKAFQPPKWPGDEEPPF